MAVNKVIYNGNTLIDLTSDTVVASAIVGNKKAFRADGVQVTGQEMAGATVYQYGQKGYLFIPETMASVSGTNLTILQG